DLKDMVVKLGYGVKDLMYYHFLIPRLSLDYDLHSLNVDADVLQMSKYVTDYKIILVYVEHGSSNVDTSMFATPKKGVSITIDNHLRKAPIEIDSGPDVNRNFKKRVGKLENDVDPFEDLDEILDDYANTRKQITRDESTRKQMVVHVGGSRPEEESDTEGNDTRGTDSEDLDYDTKCDEVFNDEHIVEDVHVSINNFSFTTDPKHDTSIGDVNVQEDLDVIDYDLFGQQFATKKIVKGRVKKLSVKTRRQLILVKNDKEKVRVRCEDTIPVLVPYVAMDIDMDKNVFSQTKGGLVIRENNNSGKKNILGKDKTMEGKGKKVNTPNKVEKYSCPWTMLVTYTNECRWEVRTLIEDHKCIQSRSIKACTSRFLLDHVIKSLTTSLDIPVRAVQDQTQQLQRYSLLREYAQELINQNPGTIVRIDVQQEPNPESEIRTFRRVYMCLGARKQGFRACGREILGLDGCFMSAERKASWCWFLNLLGEDLGIEANFNYTFIFDRQQFKGGVYKEMLWNAAKATFVGEFKKKIGELKKLKSDAYDWSMKILLKQWNRAYFLGRAKYDLLLNNICEVFNRQKGSRGQGGASQYGGFSQASARNVSGQAADASQAGVISQAGARKVSGQVVGASQAGGSSQDGARKVSGQASNARKALSQPSAAQSTANKGQRRGFQGPIAGPTSGSQRKTKKLVDL
ncbi:hypothetical protein Tco_0648794, partial [Tanacetum coccineum]